MDYVSSPPKLNHLIIPCFEEESCCYEIYIIPVSDLGRARYPLTPKLVISCLEFGCELCVLGTTVYMVVSNSNRVSTFDLSPILYDDVVSPAEIFLKEEMMRDISPMSKPKRNVQAVPTPAGKILAFSREIIFVCSIWDSRREGGNFELYDPEKDYWEEIPPINGDWDMHRLDSCPPSMRISSCAFIDESTFLIQVNNGRIFLLFLEGRYRWEEQDCLGGPLPFRDFSCGMVGPELCLTPFVAWDIKNVSKHHAAVCHFQSAFGFDYACSSGARSQAIIFDKRSSYCFLLETAQLGGDNFLTINVYLLDVVKYFEEKVGRETMYLKQKFKLDMEKKEFDTNVGSSLCEILLNYPLCNINQKPSLPSCAPKLGCSLVSSTKFRLSPGSSLPRTLTDSLTFLSGADVRSRS